MSRSPRKKSFAKFITSCIAWLVALSACVFCAAVAYWFYMTSPVTKEGEEETQFKLQVHDGMSVKEAASLMEKEGIIRSGDLFYIAARFSLYDREKAFTMKSGVYSLSSAFSMKEIYGIIQEGTPDFVTVRIPEGLTMRKTALILEESGVCKKDDFMAACRNEKLLSEFGIPAVTAEGFLFPDTYFFSPRTDAEEVCRVLIKTFFDKVSEINGYADKKASDFYHTVILASIIEREYRIREEAPLIASVFANRIKRGSGLYSCATIEYIITEIEGRPHPERITAADLKIESPYNTYKWAGLPPSPISNPGKIALDAAMNPADTDYFYFVLTDPKRGSHTFSKNFDEHKAAQNITTYSSKDR